MSKKAQLVLIIILLASLATILAVSSTYSLKNRISNTLTEETIKNNLVLTQQTASLLEKEMQTIQDKVGLLANLAEVQDGGTEACNEKIAKVAQYLGGQINNVTRINTNLTLDCALNKSAVGFQTPPDSTTGKQIKNKDNRADLSYAGYSPVTNQQILYLTFPVFGTDGIYKGVIGGVIYLKYIGDKYLDKSLPSKSAFFTLIDDNGAYLYHPTLDYIGKKFNSDEVGTDKTMRDVNASALEDTKNNKSGTSEYIFENRKMLQVHAPATVFPNRKWTLILTTPEESVINNIQKTNFGELDFFITLSGTVTLTFLVFSGLVLVFIINGLFKPLTKIRVITEKIGKGDLNVSIDPRLLSAKSEFGQLTRSVKIMFERIKLSRADLEQKIKSRTKELEASKAQLEKRAEDLAKINKSLVNRELKMVALKKELEALKNKKKPNA